MTGFLKFPEHDTGTDMRLRIILLLLMSVGAVRTGGAATWSVEKDGSGEFTSIHDAMQACAPGDTIRPGQLRQSLAS